MAYEFKKQKEKIVLKKNKSEDQPGYKYSRAAGDGHNKQVPLIPCGQKTDDQGSDPWPYIVRSSDNRRERHNGQRHIRDVVQKRAEPGIGDLFAEHQKRQHSDAVYRKTHDQ